MYRRNVTGQGRNPSYYLPQQELLKEALHMCKVLGRCSSHDHFYPPCSISQESQEVPGWLPPLLNSFQGIRSVFKWKGCFYHQSAAMQIFLANTVNSLSACDRSRGVHYLVLSSAVPEHFPVGPLRSYHVPLIQELCQCRSRELDLLMFLGSANPFERISSVEPEEPLVRVICWVFL